MILVGLQKMAPSSSVITLGANADSNGSGNIMIGWVLNLLKVIQNLENIKVMELQMVHLFIVVLDLH